MAEPGYGLTVTSLRRLRKLLWRYERKPDKIAPPVRIPASFSDTFPHRLAKPASGQSFNGATPTVSTPCDIYAGDPGSEVKVQENIPVYQGRQLQSSETIGDTEWVIVGEVNSRLQLVSPRTTGGGGSGSITIVAELGGDLAKTNATAAGTVVDAYGSGAPSGGSSVTLLNPAAKGGNYQYKATAASQYVTAIHTGSGTSYLIVAVQPVTQTVVTDIEDDGTDLIEHKIDIQTTFADNPQDTTIIEGEDCVE